MASLVSIIIPTFNRASLLGETLDSVLNQTYENWECIVVDDGSEDYTTELMEFYCERDTRIQYRNRPLNFPKGANSCRNHGFEICKGSYINWLDSDDLISKDKLKIQVKALIDQGPFSISTCSWQHFTHKKMIGRNENLDVFKSYKDIPVFLNDLALSGGFFPPHVYLLKREIVESAGNWLPGLKVNQDGEFFSRIFVRAEEIIFCEDAIGFYRKNEGGSTSELDTPEKVEHAIISWKIIENLFLIEFGEKTKLVSISKKYLFERINNKFPELAKKHKGFFHRSGHKSDLGVLIKKIRRKIGF